MPNDRSDLSAVELRAIRQSLPAPWSDQIPFGTLTGFRGETISRYERGRMDIPPTLKLVGRLLEMLRERHDDVELVPILQALPGGAANPAEA